MEIIWEKKAAKTITHPRIVPSTNSGSSVSGACSSTSVGGMAPLISAMVTSESWWVMAGICIPFSSSEAMAFLLCVVGVTEGEKREGGDTIERTTVKTRNKCGFGRDAER